MYLGATTWTFSWAAPYDEPIKRIAKLGGFKSVELTIWDEKFLKDYFSAKTNKYLRDLAESNGLKINSVFCIPPGIASPEEKLRKGSVEYFKLILEAAKQLGANIVITLPPNPFDLDIPYIGKKPMAQEWRVNFPLGLDWDQNWRDMIDTFQQFASACESMDIKMALEPHPWRMMHNAAGMKRIIEHVDSEAIGMNLDPSHLFAACELPNAVVYEIGDRIFNAHLSDNNGTTNAHWRPGKGQVDYRALLIALNDIGYEGALSLELEDVPGAAGYPGFNRSPNSTEEIEREHKYTQDYLIQLCEEENIKLDI